MKIKQGTSCQQMQFSILDDLIATDNLVRIIDGFVDKLDLSQIGILQRSKNGMIIKPPPNNSVHRYQREPGGAWFKPYMLAVRASF